MPEQRDERIRARARALWEEEGRPEGRADVHWEKARILVAAEDDTGPKPGEPERSEPAPATKNPGFPTAQTDGDREPFPARGSTPAVAPKKATGTARRKSKKPGA